MKNEEIKVPESVAIEILSHSIADLVNNSPLSMAMKIYIMKDVLSEMVTFNQNMATKEIEEYNNNMKQLEQQK